MVKHLPTVREIWVQSLGREDLLEKEMAVHSSTLAWKIPWMEEHGRLQSMGSQRVGHDWATSLTHSHSMGFSPSGFKARFLYQASVFENSFSRVLVGRAVCDCPGLDCRWSSAQALSLTSPQQERIYAKGNNGTYNLAFLLKWFSCTFFTCVLHFPSKICQLEARSCIRKS